MLLFVFCFIVSSVNRAKKQYLLLMPILKNYQSSDFFTDKAKKAYKKTVAETTVEKTFFETLRDGDKLPEKGLLFYLKFLNGKSHGVGRVILYNKVEKTTYLEKESRAELSLGGKSVYFGIEDPNYQFRATEPYNRSEQESYIPITAGKLQVMETFNDGRIFIQEQPSSAVQHFIITDVSEKLSRIKELVMLFKLDNLRRFKNTFIFLLQDKTLLSNTDAEYVYEIISQKLLDTDSNKPL